jgi:hypothetical protein
MADSTASGKDTTADTPRPRLKRRIRRLERRLANVRAEATRRAQRLDDARSSGAKHKVERRRARKVERAQAKGEQLEAAIAKLRPQATPSPEPVFAYCLRDRERVAMEDPEHVTMKNGRAALGGRCPRCGQRLMRAVAVGGSGAG